VTRIELAPEVGEDFERILAHLEQHDAGQRMARLGAIIEAINVLETSPLIGRPCSKDMRELVIGRRSHGYIALYRYIAEVDTVFVLAIRSQNEAGYADRD